MVLSREWGNRFLQFGQGQRCFSQGSAEHAPLLVFLVCLLIVITTPLLCRRFVPLVLSGPLTRPSSYSPTHDPGVDYP